jgi:hypothetical protein
MMGSGALGSPPYACRGRYAGMAENVKDSAPPGLFQERHLRGSTVSLDGRTAGMPKYQIGLLSLVALGLAARNWDDYRRWFGRTTSENAPRGLSQFGSLLAPSDGFSSLVRLRGNYRT